MAKSLLGGQSSKRLFTMSVCLNVMLVLFIGLLFFRSVDGFQVTDPVDAALDIFSSVNSPTPPAWATAAQIAKAGTLTDRAIELNLSNGLLSVPTLGKTYTDSKAAGDSDSAIYDKLTAAIETHLATVTIPAVAPAVVPAPVVAAPVAPVAAPVAAPAAPVGTAAPVAAAAAAAAAPASTATPESSEMSTGTILGIVGGVVGGVAVIITVVLFLKSRPGSTNSGK